MSIKGTNINISTKELSGSARVYYIFNNVSGNALASIEPMQALENQDIRTAIHNSTSLHLSLFVPEVMFNLLVKPQIKLLEVPSLPQSCYSCHRRLDHNTRPVGSRDS
jgi:dynamin 1-like protein